MPGNREALLTTTEMALARIREATRRERAPWGGEAAIGLAVGAVINQCNQCHRGGDERCRDSASLRGSLASGAGVSGPENRSISRSARSITGSRRSRAHLFFRRIPWRSTRHHSLLRNRIGRIAPHGPIRGRFDLPSVPRPEALWVLVDAVPPHFMRVYEPTERRSLSPLSEAIL